MNTRQKITFGISVISSLLFMLVSWIWAYYFNLILGIPLALISFFTWRKVKEIIPPPLTNLPLIILGLGIFSSIIVLVSIIR